MSTQKPSAGLNCAELLTPAERELTALVNAVTELCGPEQARMAADLWLHELESLEALPGPTSRDWREVTLAALVRLARRLAAATPSRIPQAGPPDAKTSPQHGPIDKSPHFWIHGFAGTNSIGDNCLKRAG